MRLSTYFAGVTVSWETSHRPCRLQEVLGLARRSYRLCSIETSVAILACDIYQIQETALREREISEDTTSPERGAFSGIRQRGISIRCTLCCIALTGALPMPSHLLATHGGAAVGQKDQTLAFSSVKRRPCVKLRSASEVLLRCLCHRSSRAAIERTPLPRGMRHGTSHPGELHPHDTNLPTDTPPADHRRTSKRSISSTLLERPELKSE
jgi:hypothetical protein